MFDYVHANDYSIPRDKPVILFLLDEESCRHIERICERAIVIRSHQSTVAVIRKKSKMKYNDFVFTTDIASADWEWVRRNFIVGFLWAGWGGYSIESSYFWEDDSHGLHFSRNLPEDIAETPLLNLVLAGEVF
jgi:hypothetical protein